MRPPNVWHGNENKCWSGNDQSLRCDGVNAAGVSLVPARLRSAAMIMRLTNRPYSHKDFLKNRWVKYTNQTGICKIRRAIYVLININDPSVSGSLDGIRPIHRVVFPFQSRMASLWKRWRVELLIVIPLCEYGLLKP